MAEDKKTILLTVTPAFERPSHWPKPKGPPKTEKGWKLLHSCTRAQLKEAGYTHWESGIFLFPCEWYDHIPEGFEIVTITGSRRPFSKANTSNDKRMGCLPYGVKAID